MKRRKSFLYLRPCLPFSEGLNPPLSTVSIFFNLSLTRFLFCDFVVPDELFLEILKTSHFYVDSDPGEGTEGMGRLHPKVVPFSGFRYMKRLGLVGQSVVSVNKKGQNG